MSKLSKRCEQRKAEAETLAEKFNALDAEEKKLANEKAQVYAEFQIKNAQYGELLAQVKEEEGAEKPAPEATT